MTVCEQDCTRESELARTQFPFELRRTALIISSINAYACKFNGSAADAESATSGGTSANVAAAPTLPGSAILVAISETKGTRLDPFKLSTYFGAVSIFELLKCAVRVVRSTPIGDSLNLIHSALQRIRRFRIGPIQGYICQRC